MTKPKPSPSKTTAAGTAASRPTTANSSTTELKAKAHGLKPVVAIGDKGLSPNVTKEVELALSAHGLIKVRVYSDERETRLAYAQTLCQETGATLVQHIGKLLVLYRPTENQANPSMDPTVSHNTKPKKPRTGQRVTKRQALS